MQFKTDIIEFTFKTDIIEFTFENESILPGYSAGQTVSFRSKRVVDITVRDMPYLEVFTQVYDNYKNYKNGEKCSIKDTNVWFVENGKLVAYMYTGDLLNATVCSNDPQSVVAYEIQFRTKPIVLKEGTLCYFIEN